MAVDEFQDELAFRDARLCRSGRNLFEVQLTERYPHPASRRAFAEFQFILRSDTFIVCSEITENIRIEVCANYEL